MYTLSLQVKEKHAAADSLQPGPLDRAYYPTLKDIRWRVYAASRGLSLSQIDQVSGQFLINFELVYILIYYWRIAQ